MTEAAERRCPWGHDDHLANGTVVHKRYIDMHRSVACVMCGGSNRYADWMQHPEYARQVKAGLRVDER